MSYLGNQSEETAELFSNITGLETICLTQRLYQEEIRNNSVRHIYATRFLLVRSASNTPSTAAHRHANCGKKRAWEGKDFSIGYTILIA